MPRPVVITGLGAVSALGVGTAPLWQGLCAGRSALKPITRFDATGFACKLAGEVPEPFSIKDFVPKHYRKATKVMARDIELAVAAAKEAADSAHLITRGVLPEDATEGMTYPTGRVGCHIGAGLIAADSDELSAAFATARDSLGNVSLPIWGEQGMENLTPLWMLKYLPNMLACHVTIIHGCEGPSNTITCAEASGLLCLGESARVIERGDADACFSGSAESKLNLMGLLRMQFAGRAGETGTCTDGGAFIQPFDTNSPGGIIGEGAGILILEDEHAARQRNATIWAKVSGTGAGHSPRRPPQGALSIDEGFLAAIDNAIADAKLTPDAIDAVVLLGSGVPGVDAGEGLALAQLLGTRTPSVPVVTIGPSIGNTAAGNGGLLAVVAAMVVKHQTLPARINTGHPKTLNAGPAPTQAMKLKHVLVATSSLAGQNAAAVLSAVE
ncbi:MAG: beta-ketoacyl synthase N-terminal-like domain-containing protein [bacterium]